jgi:hypothetical protein
MAFDAADAFVYLADQDAVAERRRVVIGDGLAQNREPRGKLVELAVIRATVSRKLVELAVIRATVSHSCPTVLPNSVTVVAKPPTVSVRPPTVPRTPATSAESSSSLRSYLETVPATCVRRS